MSISRMTYCSPTAIAPQALSRYRRAGEVPDYVPRIGTAEMLARERQGQPMHQPPPAPRPRTTPTAICRRCFRTAERCTCDAEASAAAATCAPPPAPPAPPAQEHFMPNPNGRPGVTRDAALEWLAFYGTITADQLREACGEKVTLAGCKSALNRMLGEGVIERVCRGRYRLSEADAAAPAAPHDGSVVKESLTVGAVGEAEPATEGGGHVHGGDGLQACTHAALATDMQWPPITPISPEQADECRSLAEAAEARAALVTLQHFVQRAQRREAAPVEDIETKLDALARLRDIVAADIGEVLSEIIVDLNRLQALAEAQS